MYLHLVCSCISSCKNLIVKYKVEGKRKKQEGVQVFLRCFSLLRATVFFLPYRFFFVLFFFIAVLSPQQLSVKLTILPIVHIVFSEHKLYGFTQSDASTHRCHIRKTYIYIRMTYDYIRMTHEWHTSA